MREGDREERERERECGVGGEEVGGGCGGVVEERAREGAN